MIRGRNERHRLITGALLIVSVFLFGGCTDLHPLDPVKRRATSLLNSSEVTIGVVWPENNDFGNMPDGVSLAIEDINKEIALLPPHTGDGPVPPRYKRFRIRHATHGDNFDDGDKRVYEVASEMVDDPSVIAVVGYPKLAGAKQAAVVYSQHGVFFMNTVVTSSVLSRIDLPFVFRVIYGDHGEAVAIADLLEQLGYTNVALITERQTDSIALSNLIIEEIHRRDAKNVAIRLSRYYREGNNPYKSTIPELLNNSFDAIVISGTPKATIPIVKAIRTMRITTPLVGAHHLDTNQFVSEAGDAVNGMIITSPHEHQLETTPQGKRFSQRFAGRFGRKPDTAAILAYEAVMFIRQVIVQVNSVQPDKVDAALRYIPKIFGITGREYSFNRRGDIIGKKVAFRQVKDGELVFFPPPAAKPTVADEHQNTMEKSR